MATAFAEPQGAADAPPPNTDGDIQTGGEAINFEAEAAKMGWVPKDQFKGDPEKHIDAETFFTRSQDLMPILKAANKQLREKQDRLERDMKKARDFFAKAEERGYERAKSELTAKMEAAVEAGDVKAHREALQAMDNLQKPEAATAAEGGDRAEEFASWMASNRWYANDAFRPYADAQAEKLAKAKGGVLDRADLDAVAEQVKAKFGEAFPDEFGVPKAKTPARNAVDPGGNAPAPRGGKSFNSLPPEAQNQCDRFIKQGIIKDRADYVKNYKWD